MTTLFLILLASMVYFAVRAHGLRGIAAEDCPEAEILEDWPMQLKRIKQRRWYETTHGVGIVQRVGGTHPRWALPASSAAKQSA
jgi:hypothetical protein